MDMDKEQAPEGEEADAYDPVLPVGMQPNAAVSRLRDLARHFATSPNYTVEGALARLSVVAAMANQAQAKRFLQGIGLIPTAVGQVDNNYISYRIKDPGESKTANIITNALGQAGTKRTKDFGPPIHKITKTLEWVWEVPGKGAIVYYPEIHKVAFMNKLEYNKNETS